jgi:phenylacetic acid degradation operon negative regulatory protein
MNPLSAAVQALLRRLHDQHPLRGGSLIVTLFGDAIAPRGGVITLGSLIRLAGVFRLSERLVRTSVARLANDGWLVARKDGRQSEYRLTSAGAERFAEATKRIYGKAPEGWDGEWTLVVLPPSSAERPNRAREGAGARREQVRNELRWLGFGQLAPGTFAHPNCTVEQAKQWLANVVGAGGALCLRSSSGEVTVDRQLVALGWDLGELTRRYRRFAATFDPVAAAVRSCAPVEPEAALVIRTLLIHEYRKIHLQDPLLPATLLPHDWVGAAAYEVARRLYSQVFEAAEKFLSGTARTVDAPLPPAEHSVYERFGGTKANRASPRAAPRKSAGTDSHGARREPGDRLSK